MFVQEQPKLAEEKNCIGLKPQNLSMHIHYFIIKFLSFIDNSKEIILNKRE